MCLALGLAAAGFLGGRLPGLAGPDAIASWKAADTGTEAESSRSMPSPDDVDCDGPAARRTAGASARRPEAVVRGFFAQHATPGRSRLYRPIVADLAGVDPFAAAGPPRVAGITLRQPRVHRLLPPTQRPLLEYARQRVLEAALSAPTPQEFIAAASEDAAAMRRGWRHIEPATLLREDSALAHALRTRGGALLRRIHELPAAAFGLHELAVAIEQGIDAADFLAILDRSGVDATGTWKHYALTRRYNLADVAVVHVRPRILRALVARGVGLPAGMPSAWDELALALPATRPAPAALADVAGQLAQLGKQPYLPSTAARIAALAPDTRVPELHPDAAAALAVPEVREGAERLTALVERTAAEAAAARRVSERCRDVWLAAAGDRAPGLAAKLAQDEAMRGGAMGRMGWAEEDVARAQRMFAELSAVFVEAMEQVGTAAAAGDWQRVLHLLDRLPEDAPEELTRMIPQLMLRHTLDAGAALDVVHALIEWGDGSLPPDFILTLLGTDRDDVLQVAADLEAWGLDPGYVDAAGRNAVSHLVDDFRTRASVQARVGKMLGWLDYLASRSVPPQSSGRGLDPLDTVLFTMLERPTPDTVQEAMLLARGLVAVGATVGSSQREIAARIKATAPDAYAELIAAVPELAPEPA